MSNEDRFKPFPKLKTLEKLKRAKADFRNAVSADSVFQQQARLAYRFYASNQYTEEERQELQARGRPDLTCNLIKPVIELVKGVNEQNRIDVKAHATEQNDGFLADILNDVYDKIREIEDTEMQEDDGLENMAITGRGFCAVDIAPDPKRPGEIKIPVVSILPSEIRLDPAGRRQDLSDCRYLFWHKWITYEDFAIKYPDHVSDIEDVMSGDGSGDYFDTDGDEIDDFGDLMDLPLDTPTDNEYSRVVDSGYYDKSNGHIRVVHMEYWENYDRYYALNPQTGQLEEIEKKNLDVLKKHIPNLQYQTVPDKRVKWFQFTGHKVLYDGDSPIPYDGFSVVAEFGYQDKSRESVTHFGVVKDMIDPQREANKRWSQTLNLYLKQSQSGYFVEKSAILDDEHWKDTINAPGEDTVVANGAIRDGKIKEKQLPQLPTGALHMHEMAKELMKEVSGINTDLLGISNSKSEPGVVLRLRQKQGLTIMEKLFKNHHKLQEQLAKRIFAIIMAHMPDTQIQRILGDNKNYKFNNGYVADLKNGIIAPIRNLKDLKYNIDTDESPANMTRNMAQLAIFVDMMSKGFPVDPSAVIKRLDLPEKDKSEWREYIEAAQKAQREQAQMEMQMKGQQVQGSLQLSHAGLQQKGQIEGAKIGVQREKNQIAYQKIASVKDTDMRGLAQRQVEEQHDYLIELSKLDFETQKMVMDMIKGAVAGAQQPGRAMGVN